MKSFFHSLVSAFALCIIALAFFSCSLVNSDGDSGELTVALSQEQISALSQRSADTDGDMFLEVYLKGDITQSKTASFSSTSQSASITFSELKPYAKITVEAYAGINGNDGKTYKYSGKSDDIEIQSGENTANLTAKDISRYNITVDANGGTISDSTQTEKSVITTHYASDDYFYCYREGYTLKGYALSATGAVVYSSTEDVIPCEDITLYAVWEKEKEYTIILDANGGTFTDTPTETTTKTFTLTDLDDLESIYGQIEDVQIEKDDYQFQGFALSDAGDVISDYSPIAQVFETSDTCTLYAQWGQQ